MAELLKRYLVYLPEAPRAEWEGLVRTYEVGKDVHWEGGQLRLEFEGNRVVALAGGEAGGRAKVLIDGKKPSEHPECYTVTRPSGTPGVGWPAIKKIGWERPPVVESWEAICSGFNEVQDEFTFVVRGSVTGEDGGGNAKERFASRSGRVVIEPEDWVFEYDRRVGQKPASDGYRVRWRVELMGVDEYAGVRIEDETREYGTVLASDLANGKHELRLLSEREKRPNVRAIRVYRPPFGRQE
jgi:hypothetical protein